MGDLIDFDSRRRKKRWTRPEDYGAKARTPRRRGRLTPQRRVAIGWAVLVLAIAAWVLWPQFA